MENRPKSFGEGISQGFGNAGSSIWSGFTGIFVKPAEGFKEHGISGLVSGIGKGAGGFVTKTLSGTVDVFAKPLEGLNE